MLGFPDTPLVREARALIERAAPPPIVEHSLRTYRLGAAYGAKRRLAFDDEALMLAALFHDLGLCDGYGDRSRAFTLSSSRAMRAFLEERGVAADRIALLADAIELHMRLLPRWSKGNDVGLLQVGAWMDAVGLRRGSVRDEARAIAAAHTRDGFDALFRARMLGSMRSWAACTGLLFPRRASG